MFNRSLNKTQLIGNLGKDPEMRYMPNGNAVANLTLATTESWKDKLSGMTKEKTEWHRLVVYGRLAEMCGEFIKKGNKIYAEGKLQTRKWTDQGGQDRYTTEIIVSKIELMDGKNANPQQNEQPQHIKQNESTVQEQKTARTNQTAQYSQTDKLQQNTSNIQPVDLNKPPF